MPIRQLTAVDRVLPSRSGRVCRVLCPFLVVVAGCADDEEAFDTSTCGAATTLRVNAMTIPKNIAETKELAIDLDGDDRLDNQIGMITGTLQSNAAIVLSPIASARLTNDVSWHIGVRDCADGAAITVSETADFGDAIHMTGTRSADGTIVARGDDGEIPIGVVLDPSGQYHASFVRAHVGALEMRPQADGNFIGRVAFGVDSTQVRGVAARAWAPFFDEHDLFLSLFDKMPEDGRITVEEVEQSNLMKTLFTPDLEEGGMSLSVGFTAR